MADLSRSLRRLVLICAAAILLSACASFAGRTSPEDTPGMVIVPGGWFKMGSNTARLNERPEHDVYLDAFLIDAYEVSAADFARFLNEKGNPKNAYFSADADSTIAETAGEGKTALRYLPKEGLEAYPANNVSWFGADSYCRWKGKRLPWEAEWEKAARGGEGGRYPWGNAPLDHSRADYGKKWADEKFGVMVPVDALPRGTSSYGAMNMSGNVWEWVGDWYRQNYCNFCDPDSADYLSVASRFIGGETPQEKKGADAPPKYDPEGPPVGVFKVLRGGAWSTDDEASLMSTYRYWLSPEDRRPDVGFRCAK